MLFQSIHTMEAALMLHLQAIRSAFLDNIIIFLNSCDTIPFYLLLITLCWYAYDQKCGVRLFILFIISLAVNSFCKEVFEQPRPFAIDPSLGILHSSSFGFPSGGAQNMTALFLFMAVSVRKVWFSVVSLLFVLLISFSRVYLGLHFPTDVLGGWAIGATLFFLYDKMIPHAERYMSQQSPWTQFILSLLFVFALFQLKTVYPHIRVAFSMLVPGCAIGLIWQESPSSTLTRQQRTLGTLIALVGIDIFLFHVGQYPDISSFQFLLIGLWLSLGTPTLNKLFKKDISSV
jgi:membrane-associated phospholipid phosphatase